MGRLIFSDTSRNDLRNIYSYIAVDSPTNAKHFVKALKERTTILKIHPEIGKPVFPDKYNGLRQLLHKSYRIIYHYDKDVVTIVTIHHQSRLLENINPIKDYTK